MNEKVIQYVWEKQLFIHDNLKTNCGKTIVIQYPGMLNKHQGPDFIHARLIIDSQEWIGSVEIHKRTSDWYVHRHQHDANYTNVILHVVWQHDSEEFIHSPVLELCSLIENRVIYESSSAITGNSLINCNNGLPMPVSKEMNEFLCALGFARMQNKTNQIIDLLKVYRGDWETVTWLYVAKGFGSLVNADTFFALAQSIPFYLIRLYKYDQEVMEAILYGQSGLLNDQLKDEYPNRLLKIYTLIKQKFGLMHIANPLLFLRMRPSNFPTIRMSQLVSLYHKRQHVFRSIIDGHDRFSMIDLMNITASAYWEDHVSFGRIGVPHQKSIGNAMANNLIVNVFIPILLAYSTTIGDKQYKNTALGWLHDLRAESNSILDQFKTAGFKIQTAFESQSILELHRQYCSKMLCNSCVHGRKLVIPN